MQLYDFTDLSNIIATIKDGDTSSENMYYLKEELNEFFKDVICDNVIYTENVDKPFFGMIMVPKILGDQAVNILTTNKIERLTHYSIELDSKLFDELLGLTNMEIVSILINDISNMTKDTDSIEKTRQAIDEYLTSRDEVLIITKCIQYRELLAFAIKDSIYKFSTIFCNQSDRIIANDFMVSYGLNKNIEDTFEKIAKYNTYINREPINRLVVLQWALLLYKDVKHRRIGAIKDIEDCMLLSPSKLEAKELTNISRELKKIDDDSLITEFGESIEGIISNLKYEGIRSLEDDLYEYNIRVKNVEGQDEAVSLMRDINNRMAIIDDYIRNEADEKDRDRFLKTYYKYAMLREKLSKSSLSKYKYLGLYVEYPQQQQ